MDNDDIRAILYCLAESPCILKSLIAGIPEELLKIRRIPNKWSIHEHACHLAEVQPMLLERLKRFKQEDEPDFQPYVPGATVTNEHLIRMNLGEQLQKFEEFRKEQILFFRSSFVKIVEYAGLEKPGKHQEYSLYTPHILMRHILMHDHLHMYRIEEMWLTKDEYLVT